MLTQDSLNQLRALRDTSVKYDLDKHDYVLPASKLLFDEECRMVLPPNAVGACAPVTMTPWSMDQLYAKFGNAFFGRQQSLPKDYFNQLVPGMRAGMLAYHGSLAQAKGRSYTVSCYKDTCRAVLGERYPLVRNSDFLDTLVKVVESDPFEGLTVVKTPYVGPDKIYVKITWFDTGRSNGRGGTYKIGTMMSNSEIGGARANVWRLVQDTTCDNSIVFAPAARRNAQDIMNGSDEEGDDFIGVSLTHVGQVERLRVLVKAAIIESLNSSMELIDRMVAAEGERLPSFLNVVKGLQRQYGWSDETVYNVVQGSDRSETRLGLVNGVTWAAQFMADAERRIEMEIMGGKLLLAPANLFVQARRKYEEVEVR